MTVADLLDLLLDPAWDLPRHATVRVGTADGTRRWEVDGAHGRAGGSNPEVVLELKDDVP